MERPTPSRSSEVGVGSVFCALRIVAAVSPARDPIRRSSWLPRYSSCCAALINRPLEDEPFRLWDDSASLDIHKH